MRQKDKRFELRLSEQELTALEILARDEGCTKSQIVADLIRRKAQQKGAWKS